MRNDEKHKTLVGGFLSTMVSIYVLYVAYTNGKQMLLNEDPDLLSVEVGYTDTRKIEMNEFPKIIIQND